MGERERLIVAEIPSLRRYARALTGSNLAADDLVQDCLERALRKHHLWRRQGRLRSWLFRMLYRIYLNSRRGHRATAMHVPIDDLGMPDVRLLHSGHSFEHGDTITALRQLPEEQRVAILLIALEDLSYEEAAWTLRIPVGTLRSRISRGRQRLRELCDVPPRQPGNQEPGRFAVGLRRVK
jgi:RNA polymerase sigma-70 factor (ECF subfamily)